MKESARQAIGALIAAMAVICAASVFADVPSPESEFAAGQVSIYSSSKHPKAKGLALRIEYPASWQAKEGRHPNVVQNLVSEGGRGLEMCVITIRASPPGEPVTPAEIDEMLSPAGLRATAPQGAIIRSAQRTKINSLPAGMIRWASSAENAGVTIQQETLQVTVLCPRHVASLTFSIGRRDEGGAISALSEFTRFEKLFQLMANSVVIENQWR